MKGHTVTITATVTGSGTSQGWHVRVGWRTLKDEHGRTRHFRTLQEAAIAYEVHLATRDREEGAR